MEQSATNEYLTPNQIADIMRRFPTFELSYETMSHKKVSVQDYPLCLAIPYGKKGFLWYTFFRDQNVCFFMELTREKRVGRVQILPTIDVPTTLALGTLFYGTIVEQGKKDAAISVHETLDQRCFVIEDILFSKGVHLAKQPFHEKLDHLGSIFSKYSEILRGSLHIALPVMWDIRANTANFVQRIPYVTHHYQYRSLHTILPHLNVQTFNHEVPISSHVADTLVRNTTNVDTASLFIPPPVPRLDFLKPQYKQPAVFEVKADLQNDIYHLYAYGTHSMGTHATGTHATGTHAMGTHAMGTHAMGTGGDRVYCGIAYIPNYTSSIFMNSIFRNIKENRNLDYIEESDDEEDFQDMRIDKHVDLNKTVCMECTFHAKFKRWVPMRLIDPPKDVASTSKMAQKIVHISKLVA